MGLILACEEMLCSDWLDWVMVTGERTTKYSCFSPDHLPSTKFSVHGQKNQDTIQ